MLYGAFTFHYALKKAIFALLNTHKIGEHSFNALG